MAWGMQLDGKKNVVVTTVGDAATRQGDFFEAICFAKERKLPVLFIVEDNAYGISTPTRKTNPLALAVLEPDELAPPRRLGCRAGLRRDGEAIEEIRAGGGPVFFWVKLERLSSHTSSDDQTLYRSGEELRDLEKCDPLNVLEGSAYRRRRITQAEYEQLDKDIKERVRRDYAAAEKAENPSPNEYSPMSRPPPKLERGSAASRQIPHGRHVNKLLRAGLEEDPRRIILARTSRIRKAACSG